MTILTGVEYSVQVHAFLVCDGLGREAGGKIHLRGVFGEILCTAFPAQATVALYFRGVLTPVPASVVLAFAVKHPSGLEEQMPDLPMQVDPKGILESGIQIQGFSFSGFGDYEIKALLDGKVIATYPLRATLINMVKGAGNGGSAAN